MAGNRLKILMVEDDAVDRAIWKKHLGQPEDAFECREEESGEAGLACAAEFEPDCILLDYNLPDITGTDFISRLNLKRRCAVVVATAYGNEDIAVRSLRTGATDYLVKGAATAEILKHALEGAVEKVRLQNEVEQRRIELEQRNRDLEEKHLQLCAALEGERQARVAAEESDARYRHLTDAIPHIVWTGTAPCEFDYVNSRWNELTGAASDAAIGGGWLTYVHEDDRHRIAERWGERARSMRSFEAQFRLRAAGGTWRWQSICGVPFPQHNHTPSRWYGTVTDIDDRIRAEQLINQKQKLESIGVLAAGVAHDFNNLLVGVIGNISLGLEVLPNCEAARPLLERAIQSSERIAALTRQLLAYAGKSNFTLRRVRLADLADSTCRLVGPTISKCVQLSVAAQTDLPEIEADSGQLQQIIMNLVINAAEAIGDKPGTICVRTHVEDIGQPVADISDHELPPGRYVVLEVIDTGCGMDSATQARIFDPFFTTKFTGRGLGLAAVQGIVRGHKGAIQVHSEPGVGTTFRVLIPACERLPEKLSEPGGPAILEPARGGVLVVDDEPGVRSFVEQALITAGFNVWTVAGGEEALDLAGKRRSEIAAVLLDLSMPGMSGEETLRRMREEGLDCPVIVSTGHGEVDAHRWLGSQSVSGFLHKPYTAQALVTAVAQRCARRG